MCELSPSTSQQNAEVEEKILEIEINLYRDRVIEECRKIWREQPASRPLIEDLVSHLKAGKIPICSVARILLVMRNYKADLVEVKYRREYMKSALE